MRKQVLNTLIHQRLQRKKKKVWPTGPDAVTTQQRNTSEDRIMARQTVTDPPPTTFQPLPSDDGL